jgi:methionyl-tRNA formyltransferase
LRIVFMGSPRFSVPALEQMVVNKYQVAAVYTQPDRTSGRGRRLAVSPVKEAALKWNIPVKQPQNFKTAEALKELADLKPDVIIVCAYGQILPQALLDIPPRQCLNVHFSLLPRHRGASPVAAAILAGDDYTGVSIQLVKLLGIIGAHLMQEALNGWMDGTRKPMPQDESRASYFGQVKKEDGEIDWNLPAVDIWRRVRAYYPWPGCYTSWRGNQLKINEAGYLPGGDKEPGRVIALPVSEGGVGVITDDGILVIKNIQYAGKKAMNSAEFIRGQRDFIGEKLPN